MDKLKRVGLFIFIFFAFLSYKAFLPAFHADKCDLGYVNNKIENRLNNLPKNEKKKRFLEEMKLVIEKKRVSSGNEAAFIHDSGVYVYLSMNKCRISDEFLERLYRYSESLSDVGSNICSKNTYLAVAENDYDELRKEGSAQFKFAEDALYIVMKGVFLENPKAFQILENKWKTEVYRRKALISQMQVIRRQENNCKMVHLPTFFIYDEISREAKWGSIK